jgi:hypothetical protein
MKQCCVLVLLAAALLLPSSARADSPAPLMDFVQTTANQQYVFVLLARADDESAYNQLRYVEQKAALRQRYPQSGLYRNDGSATPLWTVDWNAYRVDVSSDGRHLVRWGPWPWKGAFGEMALAFYEDGREMQRYRVSDLVANPQSLPASVSHYQWLDDASFDDAASTVTLQTLNGERYTFDVRTGLLIDGTRPAPGSANTLLAASLAVVVAAVGLLVVRLRARRRRPVV